MDFRLKGRRALVTGGSGGGIGATAARMLIQEGCVVVIHGRDAARTEKVAADIGAAGIAVGSLSTDEGAAGVHATARKILGAPIEILVNSAGGGSTGSNTRGPLAITTEEWLSNYHANALSSVRLCLAAVPDMVAAKWGRVINVSSAVAVQPNNLGSDYSGAKASLNNFTVSLAGSLRGAGVTANTVSPGIIIGDNMVRHAREKYGDPAMTPEDVSRRMAADKIFELPVVGRLGVAEEVAVVIVMLASPLGGYITGANYRVDGGQVRSV